MSTHSKCSNSNNNVLQQYMQHLLYSIFINVNSDVSLETFECRVIVMLIPSLEDLYNLLGLKQLINKSTRETIDTSSITDHIAISIARNVIESGVPLFGACHI